MTTSANRRRGAAGAQGRPARTSVLASGESAECGRAARQDVPRSAHGEWAPAANRPDPVELLRAQAATRGGEDPLVLQAKEAQPSVLEPHLGASKYENHGERVVPGQRMAQAAIDLFRSWQRSADLDGEEHDFYVRQLWDWKASVDLSTITYWGLHAYTRACGWSLARAHARSGDRLAIAAYLGAGRSFDRAIARFSAAYADQNERDHQRLAEAVASGEVDARHGV